MANHGYKNGISRPRKLIHEALKVGQINKSNFPKVQTSKQTELTKTEHEHGRLSVNLPINFYADWLRTKCQKLFISPLKTDRKLNETKMV